MWWSTLFSGENGKTIRNVVMIGLFLTIITVFTIVMVQKNKKDKKDQANQEKVAQYDREVVPQNLSYAESEYDTMAQTIDDSHNSIFSDDDEEAVYEVFMRMKTASDVLKLQSAYGIRNDRDLFQYIHHFMNDEEIQKINSILAQRNIAIKV